MVISIIMIVLAFAWLMYETDWLTIRLESTEYQKAIQDKVKSSQPEDTETVSSYQPSQFTPLDMPATTGELNIVCQRG